MGFNDLTKAAKEADKIKQNFNEIEQQTIIKLLFNDLSDKIRKNTVLLLQNTGYLDY